MAFKIQVPHFVHPWGMARTATPWPLQPHCRHYLLGIGSLVDRWGESWTKDMGVYKLCKSNTSGLGGPGKAIGDRKYPSPPPKKESTHPFLDTAPPPRYHRVTAVIAMFLQPHATLLVPGSHPTLAQPKHLSRDGNWNSEKKKDQSFFR